MHSPKFIMQRSLILNCWISCLHYVVDKVSWKRSRYGFSAHRKCLIFTNSCLLIVANVIYVFAALRLTPIMFFLVYKWFRKFIMYNNIIHYKYSMIYYSIRNAKWQVLLDSIYWLKLSTFYWFDHCLSHNRTFSHLNMSHNKFIIVQLSMLCDEEIMNSRISDQQRNCLGPL